MAISLLERDFSKEIKYSATRSSGSGGQNVNKVSSRVELRFSVSESKILTDDEKAMVMKKLSTRINNEGELVLTSQVERSQYRNKLKVTERFYQLLAKALEKEEVRLPTMPTKSSVIRRINSKIKLSKKKKDRNKIKNNEDF